jgi:hypothetical protein
MRLNASVLNSVINQTYSHYVCYIEYVLCLIVLGTQIKAVHV